MAGGKRPGAGRKKGSPNKRTIAKQTAMANSGLTPLEFMLTVMRDTDAEMNMRLDAAKGAAQYTHAKLQSINHSGDMSLTVNVRD